jgi:hypothetical protein
MEGRDEADPDAIDAALSDPETQSQVLDLYAQVREQLNALKPELAVATDAILDAPDYHLDPTDAASLAGHLLGKSVSPALDTTPPDDVP